MVAYGALRQLLQQFKRPGAAANRLQVCTLLPSSSAFAGEVFHGLGRVVAAAIVMRQLLQMVVQLLGKHRFERTSGARSGLEQQAYRAGIGPVMAKAGTVIVVDPKSGARFIMAGQNKAAPGGQK